MVDCSLSIFHSYCVCKTLYGKNSFFPLQLKPFSITQWNCTSISSCSVIKTNQWHSGGDEQAYGYVARQSTPEWAGIWLYKRPRRRFPVYLLPPSGDYLKEPHKRANFAVLLQMPRRHCKTCRSPMLADDGHAECMSCLGKSHADAALSGADCSHCESFSLASLRSQIAFFSESDSAPHALPSFSSQGPAPCSAERFWAAGDERAHVGSVPACLSVTAERGFAGPLHPTWSASLCCCERHDLVQCEWRWHGRQPFPGSFGRGGVIGLGDWPRPSCRRPLHAAPDLERATSSSVWCQRLSVSSGSSGLRLRSRLAAGWTSGFFRGASKPPANARPPSFPKSTTSSLNRGAPPTRLASVLLLPPPSPLLTALKRRDQGQGQGRFICHIHNHTEYNQQWNAGIFWRKIQQTRGERGGKK